MALGRPEKRTVVIKISFTETEALAVMTNAMHASLPPAVYCRRAVRWYAEFMRANSSHIEARRNVNVSTFDGLADTDEELIDDTPTDFGGLQAVR